MEYKELTYKSISFQYTNEPNCEFIDISLVDRIHSGEHHCEIELKWCGKTIQILPIEYNILDEIFSKLLTLNFNDLLIKGSADGLDGSTLDISIYYGGSSISLSVWCYDHNYKKRGLEEIYKIFTELKNKFYEYYNQQNI
jgi:hypothetical protein